MKLDVQALISFLYPSSEDECALEKCSQEEFIKKFNPELEHSIWSLSSFKDPQVRAAIHLNKFHNAPKAQRLLGGLLAQWLRGLPERDSIVIPIPLPKERERARGHNQVHSIAAFAIKGLPLFSLDGHALIRTRQTPPQTTLSSKDRRINLRGAFAVASPDRIGGKHIILVDDVYTTGTTLEEAGKTIALCKPASLTRIAIAH